MKINTIFNKKEEKTMSSLSLQPISPNEAYRNAKAALTGLEARLNTQPEQVGQEDLTQAEQLTAAFQEVTTGSPDFERQNQKLQEKLELIRQRIATLRTTPAMREKEELTVPSRVLSIQKQAQDIKEMLTIKTIMVSNPSLYQSYLDQINYILEKELKPGQLTTLVAKLPKLVKEEIYKLHKDRLRRFGDKSLAKKAAHKDFGRLSFKDKDEKCRVPREERLATLQLYKTQLERILVHIERYGKHNHRILLIESVIETSRAAAQEWQEEIYLPNLSEEEKRNRQQAFIHQFAEKVIPLRGGTFKRLTPENSHSWQAFAKEHRSCAVEGSLSWKQLANLYSQEYPEAKEDFEALFDFIDHNGLDPFSFQLLFPELQLAVARHLPSSRELMRLARTSSEVYKLLAQSNSAWRPILEREGVVKVGQKPALFFDNSFYLQAKLGRGWKQSVLDACEEIMQEEEESIRWNRLTELILSEYSKAHDKYQFFIQTLFIPNDFVRRVAITEIHLKRKILENAPEILFSAFRSIEKPEPLASKVLQVIGDYLIQKGSCEPSLKAALLELLRGSSDASFIARIEALPAEPALEEGAD